MLFTEFQYGSVQEKSSVLYFFNLKLKITATYCADVNYAIGAHITNFPCFFDAEQSTVLYLVWTEYRSLQSSP